MKISTGNDGWIEVKGPVSRYQLFTDAVPIDMEKLQISELRFFFGRSASALSDFKMLRELWIWCDTGRKAVTTVLELPCIEKLDILCVRVPGGKMPLFGKASNLKVFRCNNFMNESDLIAISTSQSLVELGAQSSGVSIRSVEALTSIPSLESVDLEGSDFDRAIALKTTRHPSPQGFDIGRWENQPYGEESCAIPVRFPSENILNPFLSHG